MITGNPFTKGMNPEDYIPSYFNEETLQEDIRKYLKLNCFNKFSYNMLASEMFSINTKNYKSDKTIKYQVDRIRDILEDLCRERQPMIVKMKDKDKSRTIYYKYNEFYPQYLIRGSRVESVKNVILKVVSKYSGLKRMELVDKVREYNGTLNGIDFYKAFDELKKEDKIEVHPGVVNSYRIFAKNDVS